MNDDMFLAVMSGDLAIEKPLSLRGHSGGDSGVFGH